MDLLLVLLGAALAFAGGLIGERRTNRIERERWLRDRRFEGWLDAMALEPEGRGGAVDLNRLIAAIGMVADDDGEADYAAIDYIELVTTLDPDSPTWIDDRDAVSAARERFLDLARTALHLD